MTNLSIAKGFLLLSLFFIIPLSYANGSCVDINIAPQEELEKIKHIGESRAEQIIMLRQEKPFSSIDELDRVAGIGPARISDIKQEGLACVQPQASATSILPSASKKDDKIIPAEEKNNLNNPSAEKQLASAEKQMLASQNSWLPFLVALALAIIAGVSILFLKKNLGDKLE